MPLVKPQWFRQTLKANLSQSARDLPAPIGESTLGVVVTAAGRIHGGLNLRYGIRIVGLRLGTHHLFPGTPSGAWFLLPVQYQDPGKARHPGCYSGPRR